MSDLDDMSFEVLGTTPTNSYDENSPVSVRVSQMESDIARMRLSSITGSVSLHPPKSPLSSNKENRQDVAMDILLRRKTPSAEMLKSLKLPSLAAEFPSLSHSNLAEEDLVKLQTIVAEHQQLRENLVKANAVIKTYFTAVEKWQNDVKQSKEADRKNINKLTETNEKLQEELQRVQRELEGAKRNTTTPVQDIPTGDVVSRHAYKTVERQCSLFLAENLQFKDMEQQYVDTINCLKVNHASTEELVRMGQVDLNAQRAENHALATELGHVREENQVLIQQAEIYQKDFIAERDARQRMAGEKDEVLVELNRLRMMLTATSNSSGMMGSSNSLNNSGQSQMGCGLVRYTCPSCYAQFSNQQAMSSHLPLCGRHN